MTDEPYSLGDAPIEEQYREQMKKLAKLIDSYFNGLSMPGLPKGKRRTGFVLMVFPFEGQPEVSGRA